MSQILAQENAGTFPANDSTFSSSSVSIDGLAELAKKGFAPLLNSTDLRQCEQNFHLLGEYRRICLSVLTKNSDQLIKSLSLNNKAFDHVIDVCDAWEEGLKQQQEVLEIARSRMMAVASYVCKESENA